MRNFDDATDLITDPESGAGVVSRSAQGAVFTKIAEGLDALDMTRAEIASLTFTSEDVSRIWVNGYATAGDGGAAPFKRVASEPSHAGKAQSADGAWWEIEPVNDMVNGKAFGLVGDGTTDNRTRWEEFRAYLATEEATGFLPAGNYYMSGTADTAPAAGPVAIVGAGRGVATITGPGQSSGEFMRVNGDTRIADLRITAFAEAFEFIGAGDFHLSGCQVDTCDYLVRGNVTAEEFVITGNVFFDFDGGLILQGTTTITGRAEFSENIVSDVQRYVYRLSHAAPLFFHGNKISNIHCDDYTGTAAVARIIMSGSEEINYIDRNDIRDVVSTEADSVLIYWSFGDAIITNNTFGRFASDDDCYLVKEKSTFAKSLTLSGNTFLGGADAAEWNDVVYLLTDRTTTEATHVISENVFYQLIGGAIVRFFQSSDAGGAVGPGSVLVEGNFVYEMNGAAFVIAIHSVSDLTIRGNRCVNHHNAGAYAFTGTQRYKTIFSAYAAAAYASVRDVVVEDNIWRFTNDGEATLQQGALLGYTGLASPPSEAVWVEARNNRIEGASSIVWSVGSVGSCRAHVVGTRAVGGFSDDPVGGATAARALITLTEIGTLTESAGVWTPADYPLFSTAQRDAASAALAAGLADGTVIQMDGRAYRVDSSATGSGSATNDLSVDGLVPHGAPTPYHFGAVGDGVADDTTALQAFFDFGQTMLAESVLDYSGTWGVSDTITINSGGDDKRHTYICGSIQYLGGSDLDLLVYLENVTFCEFQGVFSVVGSGSVTYTTREVTDLIVANRCGGARFGHIWARYAKRHGFDTGGKPGDTPSHIGLDLGRCYFKECGSPTYNIVGANVRLKQYDFTGRTDSGGTTSTTQRSTLTITGGVDVLQEGGIIKFNDRYHWIETVDSGAGTIEVFPLLSNSDTSGTFDSAHGAAVRNWGANSASMRIGGLKALGCGVGLDNECLYGPHVSNLETQVVGVSYKQKGLVLGTVIDVFHPETPSGDVDILKCDGFVSNTIISGFSVYRGEDVINLFPTDPATGGETVLPMSGICIDPDAVPAFAGQKTHPEKRATSLTLSNSADVGPVVVRNRTSTTVSLERDTELARLFGYTTLTMIRTGDSSNATPGGTVIEPTTAEVSAGVTVMGGASYTLPVLPDQTRIVCELDVERDDWRISVIAPTGKAGSATIADTASTQAVAFVTARSDANYSVALAPMGDATVWVTSKTATGFTLNRSGTAGDLDVDWSVRPHLDA